MPADQFRTSSHKWLFIILVVTGISVLISNQFGAEMNEWVFTVVSAISLGVLLGVSIKMILVAKSKRDMVLWTIFAAYSALWFIGEQLWNIYYGLILNVDQFPSLADAFYLAGFATLTAFLFLLMKPFKEFISKKVFFSSIALAFSFLIPSIILVASTDYSIELFVALSYPIFDAIIFVPLLAGFVLFYGTNKNYLWFILVALIVEVATDTGFLFLEINESYYAGHPIWLGFEWANILIAYGAYRQLTLMKNTNVGVIEQLTAAIKQTNLTSTRTLVLTPIIISTAIITISFSLIQIYDFEHLSTKEIAVFEPLVYGGIIASFAITAFIIIITRRISSLKSKIDESVRAAEQGRDRGFVSEPAGKMVIFEKKLIRTDKVGKYATYIVMIIGIITSLVLGYYVYTSHVEHTTAREIPATKFIIENLKGDTVNTWVAWQLSEGETLHITVLNSDLVSADKIDAIKDAILSEETIEIQNSELGKVPADFVDTYYLGWKGALQKASEKKSQINIPTNLEVEISDKPVGDIVIVLTNLRESDGTLGFTKSIADDQQSQILKSTITIFDVENLNSHELAAVIRHEFGHALGLGHSTAKEDLMYPRFIAEHPYISSCDINAISSLYDKRGSPTVVCEN